eukprot:5621302-Alexandrium_andersonii.AAC.1
MHTTGFAFPVLARIVALVSGQLRSMYKCSGRTANNSEYKGWQTPRTLCRTCQTSFSPFSMA